MSFILSEIRAGAYFDSVVLMHLQRELSKLPGVEDAGVVMGTQANKELLEITNLDSKEGEMAAADDLVLVVRAVDQKSARNALMQVDLLLAKRRKANTHEQFRPRSISAAIKRLPQAQWVLVSVPGKFAAGVANQALDFEKNVFLYSDNVSIEDEIQLKKRAKGMGLLIMGPDCGTAMIHGIGLGFANRTRRGTIGLVAASGTGLQSIASRIHQLGGGISHAIGTGGRDLKKQIGAITTRQGLDLLEQDPETETVILVSKPPDPEVAAITIAKAQQLSKPVIVYFIGYPTPGRQLGNVRFATSLSEAASLALSSSKGASTKFYKIYQPKSGYIRGLFSGGTLAYETLLGLQNCLFPLFSNTPFSSEQQLPDPMKSQANTILDLGDDVFTVGRLHPMMDNDLRIRRIKQEANDQTVSLILLDLILGEGAHPDPASELTPVIKDIRSKTRIEFSILVIGTQEDPQDINRQVSMFKEAGCAIFFSVEDVITDICSHYGPAPDEIHKIKAIDDLRQPFCAINVGLEMFHESLLNQKAQSIHVQWQPPAGGDESLMAILGKMRSSQK